MGDMTAAHFIFIPGVLLVGVVIGWIQCMASTLEASLPFYAYLLGALLVGVVIGWILGSRAAHDALGAELRRREERARRRE